jgi:glutathione-specific gamma-glutamylcyclotransferase
MPDPFVHLPTLRERLKAAGDSELRVTAEVLAQWDERARLLGRPPNWRLTDEQREATRRAVLGHWPAGQDLWVYAYGSLMWDPGIHFVEVRQARLDGFERRFTYRMTVGRGSPECPALMLAIERQAGCCTGLAFRVPAELADNESAILWRREMVRGHYSPAFLPMSTPQGEIEALVFTAKPENPEYAGEQPLDKTAAIIASASGPLGSNLDYLEQLAAQLAALGINDPYIARLVGHMQVMHKSRL